MEGYFRRLPDATSAADRISATMQALTAPSHALEAVTAHERHLRLSESMTASSAVDRLLKERWDPTRLRDALEPTAARILRALQEQQATWRALAVSPSSAYLQQEIDRQERWKALVQPSALEQALKAVDAASRYELPEALEPYRTVTDALAFRLSGLQVKEWWRDSEYLEAFVRTSATADALRSGGMNAEIEAAIRAFLTSPIPELPGLAQHRMFLDAAGLWLPRWPRLRPLSPSERRRRFKAQLGANAQSPHVRKAKSLVHRYELALRRVIDWVMAQAFGEVWWIERLPKCNCKDLLGKWKKRGGAVLDHADYPHYWRIMIHPEHFEAGFKLGFPDPDALKRLIEAARRLRGDSHHPSEDPARFTAQDLYELRVTWIAIEEGLIALQPDHDFDY